MGSCAITISTTCNEFVYTYEKSSMYFVTYTFELLSVNDFALLTVNSEIANGMYQLVNTLNFFF